MFARGSALPVLMSAFAPDSITSPTLLAVFVLNQSDVSGTVRVVLEGEYGCRHIYFITFEVDDTVFSSVTATTMANSDSTVAVTS